MDRKLTVDVRSILIAGLVLLGLLTAYLLGNADDDGPGAAAVAAEQADPAARSVVMTGTGKASTVPDQLSFTVTVGVTRPDVAEAHDESSRALGRVLAALKKFGVTRKDTQTTGLSIDPQYRYHQYAEPEITGYRVSQSMRVTVTELAQAGKAITASIRAGGNAVRVHGISLGISDRDEVLDQARDLAVTQAREKAEQVAAATGQELGDVVSIKEVRATSPQRQVGYLASLDLRAANAAKALSDMPIRAGEEELGVTVQVVWSLA